MCACVRVHLHLWQACLLVGSSAGNTESSESIVSLALAVEQSSILAARPATLHCVAHAVGGWWSCVLHHHWLWAVTTSKAHNCCMLVQPCPSLHWLISMLYVTMQWACREYRTVPRAYVVSCVQVSAQWVVARPGPAAALCVALLYRTLHLFKSTISPSNINCVPWTVTPNTYQQLQQIQQINS